MIHPVEPYRLPIRINKCSKCLRHDHMTKSCSRSRLCPRCAKEHSFENGCPNHERCVNYGGDHISSHSACPIVQEKRRALQEQSKKQRAQLLVQIDRQQHQFDFQKSDYPALSNDNLLNSFSHILRQSAEHPQWLYAQIARRQSEQCLQKNIDYTLSSFLSQMERPLDEFTRVSSQLTM